MKFAFRFLSFLMLFASPQLLAATAPLKSQDVQGMRKTCTYEAEGQMKAVEVSFNRECPVEMEIDLFSFSRKGSADRKPAPTSTEMSKGLSGELVRGSSKTCAYRDGRGKVAYRTVSTDASCPLRSDW